LIGGWLFGLAYKYFLGGGDTWSYFNSANILADLVANDVLTYLGIVIGGDIPESLLSVVGYTEQPRALLMVRITSIPNALTGGDYWLTSAYFSLFAFFGQWKLAQNVANTYDKSNSAALVAFVFYPSLVFWGSGLSKEAVFLGGFGWLVSWYWPYFEKSGVTIYRLLLTLLLVVVLGQLKYYYMAVLIPILTTTLLINRFASNLVGLKFVITWLLCMFILIFSVSWIHPNLRFDQVASVIQENANLLISKSESPITYVDHNQPLVWMIVNYPKAVITGLLRPNIGDWGKLAQNLAVMENILLALLLMVRFIPPVWKPSTLKHTLPCLIYILLLSGLLALATPNFGTLVRYKISFLPILVFLGLYRNSWWERLPVKLP